MANISHPLRNFLVQQNLDSAYGNTALRVPLKQYIGGPLRRLMLVVTLGTLAGGTSPAYITDAADQIFQNIAFQTDNGVTLKSGSYSSFKVKYQWRNQNNALPTGTHVISFERPSPLQHTAIDQRGTYNYLVPSDLLGQMDLIFNIQTLANLTTGSPTSSSGTNVQIFSIEERDPAVRAMQQHFQPLYETEFMASGLGSGAELPVDFPRGYVYLSSLTKAYDGTTLSNTLITNYKFVKDNDTTLTSAGWTVQQSDNSVDLMSPNSLGVGYAATDFIPAFDATVDTGSKLTAKMTYGTPTTSNSVRWFNEYTVPLSQASVQAIKQAAATKA